MDIALAPDRPELTEIPMVATKPTPRVGETGTAYRDRTDVMHHKFHKLPDLKTFTVQRGWPTKRGVVHKSFSVQAVNQADARRIVQERIDRQIEFLAKESKGGNKKGKRQPKKTAA